MARFTDKRILITGATSGIGLAGAKRIAEEGGHLILTGTNPDRLDATRQAIPEAVVLANDAADPSAADSLAERVAAEGRVDGLWLNAGYADAAPIENTDAEFFDRMMATNVRGPVLQLARLSQHLNANASVVVTSSTATYEGSAMVGTYTATKGALVAMARCWATELADRGIRVNTLMPGPIDTDFRSFVPRDIRENLEADYASRLPLSRIGTADEAAAVALFLLSDDSSYVTASQYAVDGGLAKR